MRKLVEYPTPSLAERDRRWAAARKEMDARGLDCLILCGWPAMWDFNIANARYLCPIGGNAEFNVLVFPRPGEPTSFIYSPVFTDYWRGAQSWVSDVRPKRGTFGDSVADRLTELGLSGAAVGIDGLAGPLDPDGWVPHSMYVRLRERLPKVALVSLDDMMEKLRTVKSAEEIAILEKAAALGDLMLQACRDTARPGVKECEVYARMMEVMLANGGEEPTLFLWACDRHPYPHPFRLPTTRTLERGDVIICEIHPKYGGYFTHVEPTFCLGAPGAKPRAIYDGCVPALHAGLPAQHKGGERGKKDDSPAASPGVVPPPQVRGGRGGGEARVHPAPARRSRADAGAAAARQPQFLHRGDRLRGGEQPPRDEPLS